MQQRLTFVTLGVKDLIASTNFYVHKFGWAKSSMSNDNISFFELNGIILGLFPKEELAADANVSSEGDGFKGFTLAFNAHSEKEVDELFENYKQSGVEIVKWPEKVNWGGYSGYIQDLDKHLWEIAFNPFLPLDETGNYIHTSET